MKYLLTVILCFVLVILGLAQDGNVSPIPDHSINISGPSSEILIEEAQGLMAAGDLDAASTKIAKALDLNQNQPLAWRIHGEILLKMGKPEDALTSLDKAVRLDDSDAITWNLAGIIFAYKMEFNQSLTCFDQATKLNPNDHEAWSNLGLTLINLRRYDEAVQALDKALSQKRDDPNIWVNKGLALSRLGKYQEAIGCYDQALSFNPSPDIASQIQVNKETAENAMRGTDTSSQESSTQGSTDLGAKVKPPKLPKIKMPH